MRAGLPDYDSDPRLPSGILDLVSTTTIASGVGYHARDLWVQGAIHFPFTFGNASRDATTNNRSDDWSFLLPSERSFTDLSFNFGISLAD